MRNHGTRGSSEGVKSGGASAVWLCDGVIFDGSGGPGFLGDVLIRGQEIQAVRPAGAADDSARHVRCTGLVVAPGFIDIHTHSDVSFLQDPTAASKVAQGVTTEVVGNCGFSPFPVHPDRRKALEEFVTGTGSPRQPIWWDDLTGFAEAVDAAGPIMNLVPLAGHGALRLSVAGEANRRLSEEALAQMTERLRTALEQGAYGFSTGLTYVPSRFADDREIRRLCELVAEYDGLYATHSRGTPGFEPFEEAIGVARRSGVKLQFSHVALNDPKMWGRAPDVISLFRAAADEGVDVRYDVYPYTASASALTQYLPGWLQESGERGMREHLSTRRLFQRARDELADGLFGTIPWDWDRVVLSFVDAGEGELAGRSLATVAQDRQVSAEEVCLELCARYGNQVQVVLHYRTGVDVADLSRIRFRSLAATEARCPPALADSLTRGTSGLTLVYCRNMCGRKTWSVWPQQFTSRPSRPRKGWDWWTVAVSPSTPRQTSSCSTFRRFVSGRLGLSRVSSLPEFATSGSTDITSSPTPSSLARGQAGCY